MNLAVHGNATNIHTKRWVWWLARRGHNVIVIDHSIADEDRAELEKYGNVKCVPLGKTTRLPILRDFIIARRFRKIMEKYKMQSLTCHSGATGFRPALAGIHPLVLVAYGSDFFMLPYRSPIWKLIYKWMSKRVDHMFYDSLHISEEVEKYGFRQEKKSFIHFGVDTSIFQHSINAAEWRRRFDIPEKAPVIYHSRILSEDYRVHRLLEAMAIVWEKRPDAICVLKDYYAIPAYRKQLDEYVKHLGKEANIRYVPTVAYDELPYLYAMSDIAVSIRVTDSGPISVLEAIAMKVPIIASDLPSIREWVEDGETGYLVDVDNSRQIAEKILLILNEPETCGRLVSDKAYQRNIDRISMDVTMTVEDIYERLHDEAGK